MIRLEESSGGKDDIRILLGNVVITVCDKRADSFRTVPEKNVQLLLVKNKVTGRFEVPKHSLDDGISNTFKSVVQQDLYSNKLHFYDLSNTSSIVLGYLSIAPKEKIETRGNTWFNIGFEISGKTLNITELVNENTGDIIRADQFDDCPMVIDALNHLIAEINTGIAFKFLNDKFTLRDAQTVYEAILKKTVYSFRKMIEDKVIETTEWDTGRAHRPARYYIQRRA